MSRLNALVLTLVVCVPAFAGPFTAINTISPEYLVTTSYIDFGSVPNGTNVASITDGILTVTFGSTMSKRTAPGGGWGTWSEYPYSMRPPGGTLPVLYSLGATAVSMSLSQSVYVFGFEAEPNPFAESSFTATFYDGSGNELGRITRGIDGRSGARVFAASADPIASVQFSGPVDFAVGGFRYSLDEPVPEPATYALMGLGLLGLAVVRRRLA